MDPELSRPELEAWFDRASQAAIKECRLLGYTPTAWVSMIRQVGAAEAARRLLVSGDIQTGFSRLVRLGRPDLTIEWAALDDRWGTLFSDQHQAAARWRLQQAGIEPPSPPSISNGRR
jgi:hypothetical protein